MKLVSLDQMNLCETMCRIKFNQRAIQDLVPEHAKHREQHEQLAVPNWIVLLRSRDAPQHGATVTFSLNFTHAALNGRSNAATFPPKSQMTEETIT